MEKQKARKGADLPDLGTKLGRLFMTRMLGAQRNFQDSLQDAVMDLKPLEGLPRDPWEAFASYATDFAQRSVLFWDVMRERGNTFIEHVKEGAPPLLAFTWEIVSDGRTFERPVNYALVRINPPEGVTIDDTKRPFIIIDPRAGHGPGIGGFKKDSEVGVALQFGHPVYFVIFFPEPEPGQTILDVSAAESRFLDEVLKRHPKSRKPTIYGNCQGGWASMLIAANDPDKVGPVVINGAPMSYWSGSWSGNEGENPMRYTGGLLGGSWMSILASDLGGGLFDGANIVTNFESLNPANTFWTKYYTLFKKVDTERARFLEFEKWWGGYFLMNEEEILWIVNELFIGNKLARGEVRAAPGTFVDLKAIRTPVVIFSSKGDNITPPQQAINWISDVYSSTAEIKANGQVIVGVVQEDVGHLGIFVSGKVAKKEHTEITEALEYIEMLRPGLYVMELEETSGKGKDRYLSSFREVRLEDLRSINRLERKDEKPFEVVAQVSDMNEKAYTLFARPLVKGMVNRAAAQVGRTFHPLRVQHWAVSDYNPLLWPVARMAPAVRENRTPARDDNPFRRLEGAWSDLVRGSWDLFRDVRDAVSEQVFFGIYGSLAVLGAGEGPKPALGQEALLSPRDLPYVKEALAAVDKGGYPEAIARIGALVGQFAGAIPLYRLELAEEFVRSDKVLAGLSEDRVRQLRSEAGILVLMDQERTLEMLPRLLFDKDDRDRAVAVLEKGLSMEGITPEQKDMIHRILDLLTGATTFSMKKKKPSAQEGREKPGEQASKPGEKNP